jgi:hypothetical protein
MTAKRTVELAEVCNTNFLSKICSEYKIQDTGYRKRLKSIDKGISIQKKLLRSPDPGGKTFSGSGSNSFKNGSRFVQLSLNFFQVKVLIA